jgi:hypothetical protein
LQTADWIASASLIVAFVALVVALYAVYRGNRNSSVTTLVTLNEACREAWHRFLYPDSEEQRQYQLSELMNLLEIACGIQLEKSLAGVSKHLIKDYLKEVLPLLLSNEHAREEMDRMQSSPTTFEHIKLFMKAEGIEHTVSEIPEFPDVQRLYTLLQSAQVRARKKSELLSQTSIDVAKDKTQYFERVALGSGATIAAVVSFIATRSGGLRPPYLLRASLVVLIVAMIGAMYRNWRYSFYLLAHRATQDLSATYELERAKRDYLLVAPSKSLDDGQPINATEFDEAFKKDELQWKESVTNCQRKEDRIFRELTGVESATLILVVAGLVLLVILAWINF